MTTTVGVRATIVSAWSLAIAVACGGTTEGPPGMSGGSSKPIAEADFASVITAAACDNIGPCCLQINVPLDANACRSYLGPELTKKFGKSTRNPNLKFQADTAGACAQLYTKVARACGRGSDEIETVCGKVWVGLRAPGEACNDSEECAPVVGSDVECVSSAATIAGTCAVKPQPNRGVLGSPCACTAGRNFESCAATSNPGSSAGVPPLPGGGDATKPFVTCYKSDGLFCDLSPLQPSVPTCKATLSIGETCGFDSCSEAAFCSPSNTCQAKKATGQACQSSDECAEGNFCEDTGVCGFDNSANAALCSGMK